MLVFSFFSTYRMMLFVIAFYLKITCEVYASAGQPEQPTFLDSTAEAFVNGQSAAKNERLAHSSDTGRKGVIETSVIPVISSGESDHGRKLGSSEAEVRLIVPAQPQAISSEEEWLLRASSILMDFDEDTRKLVAHKGSGHEHNQHHIRHSGHRSHPPAHFPGDASAANDAPVVDAEIVDDAVSDSPLTTLKPETKLRIPVKAIVYNDENSSNLPRRQIQDNHRKVPIQNDTWIALHSPVKIYIPVRYNDANAIEAAPANRGCVQCSANVSLSAVRGEDSVEVPVPAISICSRLARKRGRINVAVTSGPKPGTRIAEGQYPVELIAWKSRGHVYSCQYTLTVVVKKCLDVISPDGGSVDCSNGTIWGSRCRFSCFAGYTLQGHRSVMCEGNSEEVHWSSPFPTCKKPAIKYFAPVKKLPCHKPRQPYDGTFVCNSNGKEIYPDGTVCQFFCFPGFLIEHHFTSSAVVVCKNGQWTPNDSVSCVATYCSDPKVPDRGTARCDNAGTKDTKHVAFKSKYKNGTVCHYRCDIGHVIPTSLLHLNSVVCKAPSWNDSSIPECKRAVPPRQHPDDCHNQTVIVGVGQLAVLPDQPLPRFRSRRGVSLTATCSLKEKRLPKGVHLNFCEATDPELRVTTTCKYYIHVEETAAPRPYSRDCKDRARVANRKGTVNLKPPRFISRRGKSEVKTVLHANCSHSGKVGVGFYINHCTAHDPELNVTGTCTYFINVTARSCQPPPDIPHASVECDNEKGLYSPRTVCKYLCDEGFVIPASQRKWKSRKCTSKLIWRPAAEPTCKRAEPPRPRKGECDNKLIILKENETFAEIKPPRFKPSFKGSKVRVKCSLNNSLPVGDHANICEAVDRELELSSTCTYDVTVQAAGCSALPMEPFGFLNCSDLVIRNAVPVGTVCNYECHESYVIPSSQQSQSTKICTSQGQWNSSLTPSCIRQTPPVPKLDSCLDRSVYVEDLSRFQLPLTEFESASASLLNVECEPLDFNSYDVYNVTCTAFDPQLRVSGSCSFELDVKNPNKVAELVREENGCLRLGPVKNGNVRCSFNETEMLPVRTLCEVVCDEGYVVPMREKNFTTAICGFDFQWNVSHIPDCVKELPIFNSGCPDITLAVSDLSAVEMNLPQFQGVDNNTSCLISCTPQTFGEYGLHEVSCIAEDAELGISSSCSFNVTIIYEEDTTTESSFKSCKALVLPNRGFINCSENEDKVRCKVSCESGFDFASEYKMLKEGWIECDGFDGIWDFERMHRTTKLPECLGQLSNTSVEVWLSFKAAVEQCDNGLEAQYRDTLKHLLLSLNQKMCDFVDCTSALQVSCSNDKERNRIVLNVNWTLEAAFNPADYEESLDVPDVEIHIENILEKTQKAITTQEHFRRDLLLVGIELWQDSYSRGHFKLVCKKDGYSVDARTDKCVECPSGTMEAGGTCTPCSPGSFQLRPGQTSCEVCPKDSAKFFGGNIPATCER